MHRHLSPYPANPSLLTMKPPRAFHQLLHRPISLHPRLWLSLALMGLSYALLPQWWQILASTRVLLAWNIGAVFYISLSLWRILRASFDHIQDRAELEDDGRFFVLTVVIASSAAILFSVPGQMAAIKGHTGTLLGAAHLALAIGTVMSAWAFTQISFAFHYAHDYYRAQGQGKAGGLIFPETTLPLYADFLYFSCIIGTSAQTADININARPMRLLVLLHCVQAFFFNTMILAIVINMAAGNFFP